MPEAALHPVAFVVAMSIVVYLHVVLGEMVPKNIALAGPDRAALVLSPPMMVIVMLLRPFIIVLNLSANGILRLLGIEPKDEVSSSYTREEVAALVEQSRGEGMIAADEYDRLAGALDFTEKVVTSVLMPVEGLTTVHKGSTPADVEALCAATGYSRFPVTNEDGTLLGYLHIKDVLESDEAASPAPDRRQVGAPARHGRPRRRPARGAGEPATPRRTHGACRHAATGRSLGLVTLEDVLEELVGEIRDGSHHESGRPEA